MRLVALGSGGSAFLCEQFQEREGGMYCHNLVGKVPALVIVSSRHTMLSVSPQVV